MQDDQSAYNYFLHQQQLFLSHESLQSAIFTLAPLILARVSQKLLEHPHLLGDYLESLEVEIPLTPSMRNLAVKNAVANWTDDKRLQVFRQQFFLSCPTRYPVIFHNLAGNLFVSGWESIMQGVLCGGLNIVRPSSRDSHSHKFLANLINEEFLQHGIKISPVHIIEWEHENQEKFKDIAKSVNVAILFGADNAVQNLQNYFSETATVIKHGHAVSFALIDKHLTLFNTDDLTKKIAFDFSVYDQAGCLSPRALFVRSDSGNFGYELAERITTQMSFLTNQLDRYALNAYELSLIGNYYTEMENCTLVEEGCKLFTSRTDNFIVIRRKLENITLWKPAPPFRTIEIYDFNEWDILHSRLAETEKIAAIGIAGGNRCQKEAARLNPDRICPIGEMQTPEFNWKHDKTHPMEEIFQWMGGKI